jgi:S1-C subfamily serine protease
LTSPLPSSIFPGVIKHFPTSLGWAACALGFGLALSAAEPEKSVVQIFTSSQQPDWDAPWRFESLRRGSGSGFVVKGKKIMTNAHVVSWARQVLVRRYQDPRPFLARVKFIGHDCDLALLEVEDDSFFEGVEALELGDLPKVRSTVVTYGYPAGGEQISYTRGVVSRIEVQTYVHVANRSLLAVQTDAAINPGNSGGPVIQDDKVAGVAFMGTPGLENTGFIIPTTIIRHFLTDVEDGKYDGFPSPGVRITPLHNPAYRRFLKLPASGVGARIDGIVAQDENERLLKEDDVLLQAGPYKVGSDGTIIYQGNRVHVVAAFHEIQSGEKIPLKIWRKGEEVDVNLPLTVYKRDLAAGNQYDVLPRYYVHGGLVFTALSLDYLKTFGANWSDEAGAELVYELFYRRHEAPATVRPEPVAMAALLADPVNANFGIKGRLLVDKINGIRIEKLEDVVRAFESVTTGQHIIEFLPKGTFECLDAAEAAKASPRILQTYGIPKDRRL